MSNSKINTFNNANERVVGDLDDYGRFKTAINRRERNKTVCIEGLVETNKKIFFILAKNVTIIIIFQS